MDKSLLVFIAVGAVFLYFITNFVSDIQKEDDRYQSQEYKQKHKYDQYRSVDSIGQEILNLVGTDDKTQTAAWNESQLKQEFLELFPDFIDMKRFVKERIRGDILQTKLLNKIDDIEGKYFSGEMSAEEAKRSLSFLK
jgi:hypothetical protein